MPSILPKRSDRIHSQGLQPLFVDAQRYVRSQWEQPVHQGQAITLATALQGLLYPEWSCVDGIKGLDSGLGLVVLKSLADQRMVNRLAEALMHRVRQLAGIPFDATATKLAHPAP